MLLIFVLGFLFGSYLTGIAYKKRLHRLRDYYELERYISRQKETYN